MPGCREVVKNDINGLIVPARSSKLLSKALLFLINDEKARLRMGIQSRKLAEEELHKVELHKQEKQQTTDYEELSLIHI